MSKFGVGERAPWEDSPPVIRNGDLHSSKKEPEYQAAKAGNMPAAINLVERLLADDTVEKIRRRIRDSKPLVLPVLAVETSGNNKIPLAMARVLARRLNLELESNENKHGPSMNQFWQENFGYGIDKLTQSEAGHLKRAASVDEIRDRLVKARYEGSERLGKEGIGSPLRSERGESTKRTEVSSALEQNYRETLASYILAKYEQADRIERRLEHLIDRRQTHLQQKQLSQPGFLSLPATRKAWQAQQAQQQAGLNRLRARLKTVQKLKSGIRIETFANSKMRKENPQLARDWDAMCEVARRHQAMAKKQKQECNQSQERSRGQTLGLSQPQNGRI